MPPFSGSSSEKEPATDPAASPFAARSGGLLQSSGPLSRSPEVPSLASIDEGDGRTLAVFEGKAEGMILDLPRGENGFGYDPLFYFPSIQKTFAELSAEEKAKYSHRGAAFRKFLEWYMKASA